MTRHPYSLYSTTYQSKSGIYFWLSFFSVTLSSIIFNYLGNYLKNDLLTPQNINLDQYTQFIRYLVPLSSPILLFLFLKRIFDTLLWKLPLIYYLPLVSEKPPDISGYYKGYVLWNHPYRDDNNERQGQSFVRVLIDQNWDSILVDWKVAGGIYLLLDESQKICKKIINPNAAGNTSVSDMAVIKKPARGKKITLYYSYERIKGEQKKEEHQIQDTPQSFFNDYLDYGTAVLIFQENFFINRTTSSIQGCYYTDYGAHGQINLDYKKSLWKYQLQCASSPLRKKWKRLLRKFLRIFMTFPSVTR